MDEVRGNVLSRIDPSAPELSVLTEHNVADALIKSSKAYAEEIAGARDRLWPKMIDGLTETLPVATTIAGLAASYIFGSGYALAASVSLYALQPIKVALEWRADVKSVQRSSSTAVAYLSQAAGLGR